LNARVFRPTPLCSSISDMKIALHAASLTPLVPLYWEVLVRELVKNDVCVVYFPEQLEEKYIKAAKGYLRKYAPHLEKADKHILGAEGLDAAVIDAVVNFAALGASESCQPVNFSGKQVLAVDAMSKTLGADLKAAKEAGVCNLITDVLPETFGEGVEGDLFDHFADKIIYLPPVFDNEVINGLGKKEGRTHQGILLVFDSRELALSSDKKYKQRLSQVVELIQRSLDVQVLDLGKQDVVQDRSDGDPFGQYKWCMLDLRDDAKHVWASVHAIQSGMGLLYWNKPTESFIRSALYGLKTRSGLHAIPSEKDSLRSHIEPLLELLREEMNQGPDEWIYDKEMYLSALEFSRPERQLKYFLTHLRTNREIGEPKKAAQKPALLDVLYSGLANNDMPEELKFRMPQWKSLQQITDKYGLSMQRDMSIRNFLYLMGKWKKEGYWNPGFNQASAMLVERLHASQLSGLGSPMCYSLPGVQARYYPNYVDCFASVLKDVFEDLRVNTEGIEPIVNNFVCGILKWEAEQVGESKEPQKIENQYWDGHERRYLALLGQKRAASAAKVCILKLYKAALPVPHAFGTMVSAYKELWDMYDPKKREALHDVATEMIELLALDVDHKREYPHTVTQLIFLNLVLGKKDEALRWMSQLKVPAQYEGYVSAQNAFSFWVMGYPEIAKEALDKKAYQEMEGADELLLQGCMSVLLGFHTRARETFGKLKQLHPGLFTKNASLSGWNQWVLLAMANKALGRELETEVLLKIAQSKGDEHFDAKSKWLACVKPLGKVADAYVIPEFAMTAGEDERELSGVKSD